MDEKTKYKSLHDLPQITNPLSSWARIRAWWYLLPIPSGADSMHQDSFYLVLVSAKFTLWVYCFQRWFGWCPASDHQCVGYGGSWEDLWCRVSGSACAMLRVTWYELQSDPQVVATCAGVGGAWERFSCELTLASSSAGLGAA